MPEATASRLVIASKRAGVAIARSSRGEGT